MSTDHQKYSTANQAAAIRLYAAEHGMDVVRTYEDDGKSGLEIGRRYGLQELLRDVQGGGVNLVRSVTEGDFTEAQFRAHQVGTIAWAENNAALGKAAMNLEVALRDADAQLAGVTKIF
jgi:DNA invertase Pin-like site-specific DNA recombinase